MKNKWKFLLMGLVLGLACVFGITTGATADNIRIGVASQYQSRRRA
jgi:F0F1-type ATP synthase membrane subunit c/vacuolar-type H+-ATPase subunit K